MKRTALLVAFVIFIVGIGGFGVYRYLFTPLNIVNSPIITSEARLMKYLGKDAVFTSSLRFKDDGGNYVRINSLAFSILKDKWPEKEDDCIAASPKTPLIFCFSEYVKDGQMIVNIYSNEDAVLVTDPTTLNKLLNFNLITIFEKRLGISQNMRQLISLNDSNTFIFKW